MAGSKGQLTLQRQVKVNCDVEHVQLAGSSVQRGGTYLCSGKCSASHCRDHLCRAGQSWTTPFKSIGPQDSSMLGRRNCCIRNLEICCSFAMLHLRISTGPSTLADGADFPLHSAGNCCSCIAGRCKSNVSVLLERCGEKEHMGSWPGMGRSYKFFGRVE